MDFKKIQENLWEMPKEGLMNVPVRIFSDEQLLQAMQKDMTLQQAKNVAMLPGIIKASIVMPDGHQGYGFPIGGVAAFDEKEGVISPGGVGYDINCGVRLLTSDLVREDMEGKIEKLLEIIFKNVPSGLGSKGKISRLSSLEMDNVLELGARWAVEHDYGDIKDLNHIEERGEMRSNAALISPTAKKRGSAQLGSLGSGNHFIEVQYVSDIYDPAVAKTFGLFEGQIVVMIHTGSRGCGHQVCSDYLRSMERVAKKFNIRLPDRELVCAPILSKEGQEYYKAMGGAANFAWANRQMITHWVRESFDAVFNTPELEVLYDVAHNIAKYEKHDNKTYMIHRKGATRALWKGRKELPHDYWKTGQPVILPGSMGTSSYVLCGTKRSMQSFASTAHGAGRVLSRSKAIKTYTGKDIQEELARKNITVRAESMRTIAEEAPAVYKDIDRVAAISHNAGIATRVVRLKPIGVVKG
ncbi:MAG: RtcB family protein [Candidatus Methanofastidiosia archaeon]